MENARGVTALDGTTKARIERAAITLFAERGVDAVTTREIAGDSGVSEGALYRHYPSKEALAQTLFLAIHKKLSDEIRAATADRSDIEAQAAATVDVYCQIAEDDWALFAYHLIATHRFLPSPDRPEVSASDDPVSVVEALIEAAIARGEIPPGDTHLKAAMALGVVLQASLHRYYGRIPQSLAAQREALTRAVIAVLKS